MRPVTKAELLKITKPVLLFVEESSYCVANPFEICWRIRELHPNGECFYQECPTEYGRSFDMMRVSCFSPYGPYFLEQTVDRMLSFDERVGFKTFLIGEI